MLKCLSDETEEIKLKESVDEELEDLNVNIEGTEDSNATRHLDDDYVENEELDVDIDDDIEIDYDDLPLDDLKNGLELEDYNDEH